MGEGYFYTLSAIAQSFAAIVALNAVFVIYKLQMLRHQHTESFNKLRKLWYYDILRKDEMDRNRASNELNRLTEEELSTWADNPPGAYGDIKEKAKKILKEINDIKQFSKKVTNWLKITMLLNGFIILCSLILLPWRDSFLILTQRTILIVIVCFSGFAILTTIYAILVTIELGGLPIIAKIHKDK